MRSEQVMRAKVKVTKTRTRTLEGSSQISECLILRARKQLHARLEVTNLDRGNQLTGDW